MGACKCSSKASSTKVWWAKFLFFATLLSAIVMGFNSVMDRYYIFDQNLLQKVAQRNIEKYKDAEDPRELIRGVAADLDKEYPGHISLQEEWVFNTAGGAMGTMWILHASITEYVIIFGTPVGTEGHTGRYFADDYFIILEGEQWAAYPGDLRREVYKPGDMHHLVRGTCQQYKIPEHGFALEYARGWIPAMLPFGLFDFFFSNLDFITLYNTFRLYGKSVIRELLQGKI